MSNSVTNKQPTEVTICSPLSPCTKNMDVLTNALLTNGSSNGVTHCIQKQILDIKDDNQCGYLDGRINKLDLSELDDKTITLPSGETIKFKYLDDSSDRRQFVGSIILLALSCLLIAFDIKNFRK